MPHSLFQTENIQDAASIAARLALPARAGHFDELRGTGESAVAPRPHWRQFFELLGAGGFADLDHRLETVASQIRENGITYNVYADADGPERSWSLDLLPFLISDAEWSGIEAGIAQRAQLLNVMLGDLYGEQKLLAEGLLPPALVYGHSGYLRPLRGYRPPGDVYLHIAAFDLARAPDGGWWVVSQRTQAPSGLGYILENRLTISRLFPEAFRELRIQHLASSYRKLIDALYRLGPGGGADAQGGMAIPRIVLLTPGPYNETYFEHAYLARYLGIPLVEGSDLTVRDDQLFLKTLYGLERVHGVLRRLDDDYCDPLELRSESTLGIPGLLQAMRAGNVLIANALGTSFLESPGVTAFLPAIARRLLDAELKLPSLPSWWCGETAARRQILPYLQDLVIKPTYPRSISHHAFDPVIGASLSAEKLDTWRARIQADPDAFTIQAYLPLSQAPTWTAQHIVPRAAMVRVFALADGQGGWHVLPGALTRIASRDQQIVSMQRGGSSLDTWVMTEGQVDVFSMLPARLRPEDLAKKRRPVSSRAAENLFWMGRYAERADNNTRLTRQVLIWLNGDDDPPVEFLEAIARLCTLHGLIAESVPTAVQAPRVFERALIAALGDASGASSVAYNLSALVRAARQIRDRLSPEHWRLILGSSEDFEARLKPQDEDGDGDYSAVDALLALDHLAVQMAAITGAQTDRMTRDDGWRLLTIGRQLERLAAMSSAIVVLFGKHAVQQEDGFDLLLGLFDSAITYRAHYQRSHEMPALIDLLVMDEANPRALACIVAILRNEIARLPDNGTGTVSDLLALLPEQGLGRSLAELCETDGSDDTGNFTVLLELATQLHQTAHRLSDEIGQRYFSHASDAGQALAA